MHTSVARKGKLITDSNFSNYDMCLNPYVGCQIGCSFCYVRFFIKDKDYDWGKFVRTRDHIKDKLPTELNNIGKNTRLVIGTMVDPYMPLEAKYRLTRKTLELIKANPANISKVGIFTRSPLVLQDADLIKSLPDGRVHYTMSMTPDNITRKLEPVTFTMQVRLDAIKKLKDAGVQVHVNLAPIIPTLCESLTQHVVDELVKIEPTQIFIDSLQAYGPSYKAMENAMQGMKEWSAIAEILKDKEKYESWKQQYFSIWKAAWAPYSTKNVLPLFCDHVKHTRIDLRNGSSLNWDNYCDYAM